MPNKAKKDTCWTDGENYYRADGKGTYWQIGGNASLQEDQAERLLIAQSIDVDRYLRRIAGPPAVSDYINLCSWARAAKDNLGGLTVEDFVQTQLRLSEPSTTFEIDASGRIPVVTALATSWEAYDTVARLISLALIPSEQEMEQFKKDMKTKNETTELLLRSSVEKWLNAQDPDYKDYLDTLSPQDRLDQINADYRASAETTDETTTEAVTSAITSAVSMPESAEPAIDALVIPGATCDELEPDAPEAEHELAHLIDPETGEVLDAEQAFEILGIVVRPQFEIVDEPSAAWFIRRMRSCQVAIEERFAQVAAMTRQEVAAYKALNDHFGPQLRRFAESQLPVITKGEKAGQYRSKNWKCTEGTVFFKSTGGWYIRDNEKVKERISELVSDELGVLDLNSLISPELAEKYGIKIDIRFSKRKLYALAEQGEVFEGLEESPSRPLGQMGIGGGGERSAWSFAKCVKQLRESVKALENKFKGVAQGDEDEDDDAA